MCPILLKIPVPEFLQTLGFPAFLPIFGYGVMVALAFLLFCTLAGRRARACGVSPAALQDIALWSLLAGVLGARLMHRLLYPEAYFEALDFLRLYNGGLVLYGAFLTTPPVLLLLVRRHGLTLDTFLKIIAPPLPAAIGVGRFGCFLNGCCFGRPTDLSCGVRFPKGSVPENYQGVPLHPTQLYACALGLILSLALYAVSETRPALSGKALALLFLLGYGGARLIEEYFRGDTPRHFLNMLTAGQATSLLFMALAALGLLMLKIQGGV